MSKSNRLYVSNIDISTGEDEIRKLFLRYGMIKELVLKEKHYYKYCFI